MKIACIPALDEEKTIAKVVIGCLDYVDLVIVCDDGSTDLTATIAERLGAQVIRHGKNLGKGEAFRSLFIAARKLHADAMVTIDGDGQHDPHDIPRLLKVIEDGSANVVIGSRFLGASNNMPAHRRIGNRLLNALTLVDVTDTQSGFRAYDKQAIESIMPGEMGMGVDSEILADASRQGLKLAEVPVSVKYGYGKTSKHNALYHTLDVISSIAKLTTIRHPLIFYGGSGLVLILAGLYFVFRTFQLYSASKILDNLIVTYGLIAFALTMVGLLTFFTGIILFTTATLIRKASS